MVLQMFMNTNHAFSYWEPESEDTLEEELRVALSTGIMPEDKAARFIPLRGDSENYNGGWDVGWSSLSA